MCAYAAYVYVRVYVYPYHVYTWNLYCLYINQANFIADPCLQGTLDVWPCCSRIPLKQFTVAKKNIFQWMIGWHEITHTHTHTKKKKNYSLDSIMFHKIRAWFWSFHHGIQDLWREMHRSTPTPPTWHYTITTLRDGLYHIYLKEYLQI